MYDYKLSKMQKCGGDCVVQPLNCDWLFATLWAAAGRLLCPSLSPRICSNSCPSSWWCYLTISSSAPPSLAFNLSWHQSLFLWAGSSRQVAQVLEFQLQHQSFQWTPRADLLQNGLVGSPCSPRNSQESSPTPQFKNINSSLLSFLYSPTHIHTWLLEKP